MRRRRSRDVLDVRALNRALLARQFLLRRSRVSAAQAIDHLVGMQAQVPDSPYIGLWTRLDGFRIEDLVRLARARRVVRIALMRSTIHLVTVRDCLTLRPLMQPAVERGLWTGDYGRRLAGLNRDALAAAARAIVDEHPRTFADLGRLLKARWPDRDGHALAMAARGLVAARASAASRHLGPRRTCGPYELRGVDWPAVRRCAIASQDDAALSRGLRACNYR